MNRLPLLRVMARPASLYGLSPYLWLLMANGVALLGERQVDGWRFFWPSAFFLWFATGAALGGAMVGLEVAELARSSLAWVLPGLRRHLGWNLLGLGLGVAALAAFASGPVGSGLAGSGPERLLRAATAFAVFGLAVLWISLPGWWWRGALGAVFTAAALGGGPLAGLAARHVGLAVAVLVLAGAACLVAKMSATNFRRWARDPAGLELALGGGGARAAARPRLREHGRGAWFLAAVEEVYGGSGLGGFGSPLKAAGVIAGIFVLIDLVVRFWLPPRGLVILGGRSPVVSLALLVPLVFLVLGSMNQVLVLPPGLHRPLSRRELFAVHFWGGLLWGLLRLLLLAAGLALAVPLAAALAGESRLAGLATFLPRLVGIALAVLPATIWLGCAQARYGRRWRATAGRKLLTLLVVLGQGAAAFWLLVPPRFAGWPGGEAGAIALLACLSWGGLYLLLRRDFLRGDLLHA